MVRIPSIEIEHDCQVKRKRFVSKRNKCSVDCCWIQYSLSILETEYWITRRRFRLEPFQTNEEERKNERHLERIFSMVYFDFLSTIRFLFEKKKHDNTLVGIASITLAPNKMLFMFELVLLLFFRWPHKTNKIPFILHKVWIYSFIWKSKYYVTWMLLLLLLGIPFHSIIILCTSTPPNRIGVNSIQFNSTKLCLYKHLKV